VTYPTRRVSQEEEGDYELLGEQTLRDSHVGVGSDNNKLILKQNLFSLKLKLKPFFNDLSNVRTNIVSTYLLFCSSLNISDNK
jgi:hypothetical protein